MGLILTTFDEMTRFIEDLLNDPEKRKEFYKSSKVINEITFYDLNKKFD